MTSKQTKMSKTSRNCAKKKPGNGLPLRISTRRPETICVLRHSGDEGAWGCTKATACPVGGDRSCRPEWKRTKAIAYSSLSLCRI